MSQGKERKCTKEMKKVKGWCTEEMKDNANSLLGVDTEELRKWRSTSQEEMGLGKIGAEVLDKYKIEDSTKRGFEEAETPRWSGGGCAKERNEWLEKMKKGR